MSKEDTTSIILVTFNRVEATRDTLNSLLDTIPTPFFNLTIVDNGSSEMGMEELLKQHESTGATIIRMPINKGWATGVNTAIEQGAANTGYTLLINNDVVFKPDWYEKSIKILNTYPDIGVFGLWKHTSHGELSRNKDLIIKDQMPAVAWMFKTSRLKELLPFKENGPCLTKGGNGEDVNVCLTATHKGYIVCGPINDLATHIDGY